MSPENTWRQADVVTHAEGRIGSSDKVSLNGHSGVLEFGTLQIENEDTIATRRGGKELETKLVKIAQLAKEEPKETFTSLIHLLDEEALFM